MTDTVPVAVEDRPGAVLPAEGEPRTEVHAPAWATAALDRARTARWKVARRLWWVVFAVRLLVLVVLGSRRAVRVWWVWVRCEELTKALREPGSDTLKVFQERAKVRWFRLVLTVLGLVLTVLTVVSAVLTMAVWLAAPALAVPAATGAAVAGRDKSKPLLGKARGTVTVTGNAIIDAHRNAGIIKAGENLEFRVPPTRDPSSDVLPAMRMVYDLPPGKTYHEVVKRLSPLGSALRRPIAALDLHMGEHEGQVDMWVAEKNPYSVPVPPWPWLDAEDVDLFTQPVPQGIDLRGQPVRLPLLWTAALISARPRRGKSYELRKLLLAAALDPFARIVIVNPKQSGDFRPLYPLSYRHVDRDARRTLEILRELERQMWRSYDILADLPPDVCPESKITRAIHRDPTIDVRLTVVGIDEIRIPFEDAEHGEEIKEVLTTLAQVGPASGLIVLAATQRPDGTVVPVGWRSVMGTRVCLQVMTEGDAKIGMGSHHSDQHDASKLPSTPGVAIVAGDVEAHASAPDGPRVTRLHEVSTLAAVAICGRARARREELGLLDGDAAGDTAIGDGAPVGPPEVDVLALARDAMGDAGQLRSVELVERLDGVIPGITVNKLAARLAPHGVYPGDIWVGQPPKSLKGYRSRDLLAALDRRARGARDPDTA